MNSPETSENPSWLKGLGEERLLALLLLALGLMLFLLLLLWRSLDQSDEKELLPVPALKHSVWFDENGPKLSNSAQSATNATTTTTKANTAANISAANSAESLLVKTIDIGEPKQQLANQPPSYWLQLASFSQIKNADALAKKVSTLAPTVEVAVVSRPQKTLYAVRVPWFGSASEAKQLSAKIAQQLNLKPLLVPAAGGS